MPQKVNPIDFENSEGNLQIANSLWEGMTRKLGVSRLQRDLSDSTTVRNIGVGLGHSLLAYRNLMTGLQKVQPNVVVIEKRLQENWSILTEGVQTLMRLHGVKDPYKLIANVSRGQKIEKNEWESWITELPVDKKVKQQLQTLTPETYIGHAEDLTQMAIEEITSAE
jgi:adenylosuccinate lyase